MWVSVFFSLSCCCCCIFDLVMISGEDWPKPFVWNIVYVLARLFARSFLTFDLIFWLHSMPDLSLVIQSRPFVSNCEKFTMNIQLDKDLNLVQLQMNRNLEWKLLLDRQSLVCESARIYEILRAAEQETHHHNNWLNKPRPKKKSRSIFRQTQPLTMLTNLFAYFGIDVITVQRFGTTYRSFFLILILGLEML